MTIRGTVEDIEYCNTAGHEKKVVTVCPDHRQKAFIEYRGRDMDLINNIQVNDEIVVEVLLDGKTSLNSGIQYNNLVGTSAKKI